MIRKHFFCRIVNFVLSSIQQHQSCILIVRVENHIQIKSFHEVRFVFEGDCDSEMFLSLSFFFFVIVIIVYIILPLLLF